MQKTFVRSLASSESIVRSEPHQQRTAAEFVRNALRANDGRLQKGLGVTVTGAAYERTGHFNDAQAFYESVMKSKPTKEDLAFARHRWLVVRYRQKAREASLGKAPKVLDIEREIAHRQKGLGDQQS